MSSVIVKENETLDSALRRFKRNCAKAGIQQEIRKREHYEKQLEKENTINVLERTTACGSSFVMCQHNLIIKI